MDTDISFFEEVQGLLEKTNRQGRSTPTVKKSAPKEKAPKGKGLLNLLTLQPIVDPCRGCPFEPRNKILLGVGDPDKAKLIVIIERITEMDILNRTLAGNPRYKKFLPLFQQIGFQEEDVYFTALTRCFGQEDMLAVERCSNFLREELSRENIKASLILGLRPFQLLIDKNRTTVFKARGDIFTLMGKPCMVTYADFD